MTPWTGPRIERLTAGDRLPIAETLDRPNEEPALDLLRELWSYEGDDVCEGLLAVERYCRTLERRMNAAEKLGPDAVAAVLAILDDVHRADMSGDLLETSRRIREALRG